MSPHRAGLCQAWPAKNMESSTGAARDDGEGGE
jgi:hypothetical protein